MIPKIIHQIWIGDRSKIPYKSIETWINAHPDWKHLLWDEEKIKDLNLINLDKYNYYYNLKKFHGSANIVRIEALYKFGGVYIDADSICNNAIDDLINRDFFAVYSPNMPNRVGNAFIGSTPNNEILKKYIERIKIITKLNPPWDTVGGTCFKQVLEEMNMMSVVLPSYFFYTSDKHGTPIDILGKNYASHFWGSTNKSY